MPYVVWMFAFVHVGSLVLMPPAQSQSFAPVHAPLHDQSNPAARAYLIMTSAEVFGPAMLRIAIFGGGPVSGRTCVAENPACTLWRSIVAPAWNCAKSACAGSLALVSMLT